MLDVIYHITILAIACNNDFIIEVFKYKLR